MKKQKLFPQYKTLKKYKKTEYTKKELEQYGVVSEVPGAVILTTEYEQFWMPLKRVSGKTKYYDWTEQRHMGFVHKKSSPNPKCKTGMRIQTYLFDRAKWTVAKARAWLKSHGAKVPKVDSTDQYHRFRQEPTSHFEKGSFRTKALGKHTGIKTVVACPLIKWA